MSRTLATRHQTVVCARAPFAFALLLALLWVISGFAPSGLLRLSGSQASAAGGVPSARTLSFEERVRYQRAVEEVYWRHTLWPKENTGSKPALDEVASLDVTRARVEATLRQSDALARQWKQPVTGKALQAEVTRMTRETRQPEVLRELWGALDNDPFIIAEVLARPALVERLARNYYATDERFHGALRAKVEAHLREHATLAALRNAGGTFSEIEAVKVARKSQRAANTGNATAAAANTKGAAIELTADEWDAETARLKASFGVETCETCGGEATAALPSGTISALQEDAESFYVTSVAASTGKRLQIGRVAWAKTSFDAWWSNASANFTADASTEAFNYRLAEINQLAADDTWTPTKALPEATGTAVWTGAEMIIWGGGKQNSGARYNPATDTWTPTSATNVPSHRGGHTAVWTGTEMIVWGGCERHFDFCGTNDGGRYNPASDTWTGMSITNAPTPRSRHVAVWTGSKMIVWAGVRHEYRNQSHPINGGGVYDPASDSWTTMSTTNAPPNGGSGYTVVWTGAEMIAWGGNQSIGGRYNPNTDTWTPTTPANAPSPRTDHTAIWTGTEMIVWGGNSGAQSFNSGGRYNPATDTWTPTSTAGAPSPRYLHTAIWTGTEMIVWGGNDPLPTNTGGRYNPSSNTWTLTNTANAPPPKSGHVAVWTGELMIVWSVTDNKTGGRYNPANDSWTPTDNNDSPPPMLFGVWSGAEMIIWVPTGYCGSGVCPTLSKRYNPATYTWRPMSNVGAPGTPPSDRPIAAVWTGTEMIVWGIDSGASGSPGEGGRYNPQTDSWRPVTTSGAPVNRSFFTGIWTGTEMIVWGGESNTGAIQNTGGRYNPSTDTWTQTSTANAPAARYIHSAVWTGAEMIVWGGISNTGHENTGGRYNPANNTWTPTSTSGAPEGRRFHTAVWTGTEMIVWGGRIGDYNSSDGLFNTGGRYNPSSDTWTPTSTAGAPGPRFKHTAIWTGKLMIVWGGISPNAVGYAVSTNTGGRYNPSSDSWTPTSTLRAPGRRHEHIAFWTGTGMLVWGGYTEDGSPTHGGYYSAPGGADDDDNTPPAVRITAPADNATFAAGATINITTETSDADGTISSVRFYANDVEIGSNSTAPFGFSWPNVSDGNYTIKAMATDDGGSVTTSASVRVSVSPAAPPPTRTNVALASNGATVIASSVYSPAYPVASINNGDRRGTNWEAGGGWNDGTPGQHPDWVEVRFGGPRTLSEVDVFTVQDNYATPVEPTPEMTFTQYGVTDFTVQYWNGANWVTIPGTSVTANGKVWNKLTFPSLTTERVRVVMTGALAGFSRLTEVEAWQDGATPTPTPTPMPTPTPDPAQRLNVALASNGATVSASSVYSPAYPVASINNGDRRGLNWEAGGGWNDATIGHYPDWVEIAFAGAKTINEVDVFTLQDNYASPVEPTAEMTFTQYGVTDFEVQYWDDAAAVWRAIPDARAVAERKVWRQFSFAAITTTKVRVVMTNALAGYSRLAEIEAWQAAATGGTPPRPNHALASNGGTVIASSVYSPAYPIAAVNNGDRRGANWEAGGGWNDATPGQHPDWVEVRFSGTKTLTEVDIFTVQDNYANPIEPTSEMTFTNYGVTDFTIQYWDGANWLTIPGASVTANAKVWQTLTFSPVTTDRIRVVVTGALAGYSRLTEVEAY